MRHSPATVLTVLLACLIACGSSSPPSGRSPDAPTPQSDAQIPNDCLTSTPCAADSDCIAIPGTRCNTALAAPRCQRLQCGPPGSACSQQPLCQIGLYCVDGSALGTNPNRVDGACITQEQARTSCTSACLATRQSGCTSNQLQEACSYACSAYPDGWGGDCASTFTTYSPNAFTFEDLFCQDTDCFLHVRCINPTQFEPPGGCPP